MSKDLVLGVSNTDSRRSELISMINSAVSEGCLDKSSCLTLRGKLGFADSFLHGRLGSLLLKRLSEHAYGRTAKLEEELVQSLNAMVKRLQMGEAKSVKASSKQRWFIYIDASYEPETKTGGLGGVLLDASGKLVSWFGIALSGDVCKALGGMVKDTLIYELEMLAAVLSLHLWCKDGDSNIHVWFGDNDSVRYALIRPSGSGQVAIALLKFHLMDEANRNSLIWFARVPTEANISDFPSRLVEHPFLTVSHQCNKLAEEKLEKILAGIPMVQ